MTVPGLWFCSAMMLPSITVPVLAHCPGSGSLSLLSLKVPALTHCLCSPSLPLLSLTAGQTEASNSSLCCCRTTLRRQPPPSNPPPKTAKCHSRWASFWLQLLTGCAAFHKAATRRRRRTFALHVAQALCSVVRANPSCAVAMCAQCSVSAGGSERGEQTKRAMAESCG
jgi:hypothetical protein